MEKITITEALAEIKLIEKKIEKKEAVLRGNVSRIKQMPDPYEKDGGSRLANERELQAVGDLRERHIKIRRSIAAANLANSIKIESQERSIAEWLIFKREVLEKNKSLYGALATGAKRAIDTFAAQPQLYKDPQGSPQLAEVVINYDYPALLKQSEQLQFIDDKLDGQLSLKNALIVIEI